MSPWVLSPIAEAELGEILDYIAKQSGEPRVADSALTDFAESFRKLAASPHIGFRRPALTGHDVRWWPIHSYLVVYDPLTVPLRVLRILHAGRDLERLFRSGA